MGYDKTRIKNAHIDRTHRRYPGTAQNNMVKAVENAATSTETQIALPSNNFFTYGSRIVRVLNGVVSL